LYICVERIVADGGKSNTVGCVCICFWKRGGWKEETKEKNTTKRQMVFRKQTRRQISNRFVRWKEIRFVGDFS